MLFCYSGLGLMAPSGWALCSPPLRLEQSRRSVRIAQSVDLHQSAGQMENIAPARTATVRLV